MMVQATRFGSDGDDLCLKHLTFVFEVRSLSSINWERENHIQKKKQFKCFLISKNLNVEGAFLFPFEDGSAFTWSRRGNLVWRNKNEYESATSERGQFEMLTQVGNKGKKDLVSIF